MAINQILNRKGIKEIEKEDKTVTKIGIYHRKIFLFLGWDYAQID